MNADAKRIEAAWEDGYRRGSAALVALQAQLDAIAEALGEHRMRSADGYHYEAVRLLVKDNVSLHMQILELTEHL